MNWTPHPGTRPAPSTDHVTATCFPTELGWMAVAWRGSRVTRLTFGYSHPQTVVSIFEQQFAREAAPLVWQPVDELSEEAWLLVERLARYSSGAAEDFREVPIEHGRWSRFQERTVWYCRQIARGSTLSYGELAARAGSPRAARAVGSVMARNRVPLIVPCHRVVGAHGQLGGFSAPEGLSMKQRLLELEEAWPVSKLVATGGMSHCGRTEKSPTELF